MGSFITKEKKSLYIKKKDSKKKIVYILPKKTNQVKPKKEEILKEIKDISESLPDGKVQYDGIKSFFDGKMSYADMRSRYG